MSADMLVTHVVHSLAVGGLENGLVNVVNGTPHDVRHRVICMTTAGVFASRLRSGVEVTALGKAAGHDVRTFLRLVALLRRERPDVVHSRNWATFDTVLAARLAGVRVVIHGEHGRDMSDPEGRNRRRNRLRRACARLVTRFVTVSDDLRGWLIREVGLPARKVVTIHNGVDTVRFAPGDPAAARRALALPPDVPVVGTVGRLDPVKDHAMLVRAFAGIVQRVPAAFLVIVGDGPCRRDLEQLVAELGLGPRVRLLGEWKDVPVTLDAMDVFVLPSFAEGISNTLLEAMAMALPVVVTRVGGNPELVEDGVNGTHVPRRDPEALTAAITRYLEDDHLRAVHGKSSRQRTVERFSLEQMTTAYTTLYRDPAGAAGRRG
jgi:sugar transferase (PEP-CTERM/EpsH1 system associated)